MDIEKAEKASDPAAEAPRPAEQEPTAKLSVGDKNKAAPVPSKTRPVREANFRDYVRIFSYAQKWDYAMMVAAGLASIGAGIVSFKHPFFLYYCNRTSPND